jgi:hypothetical protein
LRCKVGAFLRTLHIIAVPLDRAARLSSLGSGEELGNTALDNVPLIVNLQTAIHFLANSSFSGEDSWRNSYEIVFLTLNLG